ncbi:MAG TPA: MarR family transcriptional regulator [Solirubrobacteraceae bacterium]|nr:MarR family transcriptional regulator [Solirubrobacteraceae bacterium]
MQATNATGPAPGSRDGARESLPASPSAAGGAPGREALTRDMYALLSFGMRAATLGTLNSIADLDISFTQLKALCALENDGEDRSVKALAESMKVSLPAMSRAVDGLYERGFVERDEDPVDRRMKRVRLTDAGREVPRVLNEGRLSALTELIGSLDDDEADALEHALSPIVERREEIAAYRPAAKRGAR